MLHAAYGLVWEEWRCTRKLCAMSLVLLMGIALVPWYLGRHGFRPAEQWYGVLSYGLLGMFILYLTLSHSTKNDIQAGIPRRRYLLPVGTFALVFWPLAYRLALVAALASVSSALAIGLYGSNHPHLEILCCVTTAVALVTMLAWSARLAGRTMTAIGFILLCYPGMYWMVRYMDASFLPYPWVQLLLPTAAFVVTLVVTTITISVVRSGGWGLSWRIAKSSGTLSTTRTKTDHKPFRSPLVAQIWYEWRSIGLKMTLIMSCASCALLTIPLSLSSSAISWRDVTFVWYLMLLISVPAGLWAFVRHDTNARRDVGRFAQARCVDDWLLASAKLGGSAATVLGSCIVLTVFTCLIVFVKLGLGYELTPIPTEMQPVFVKAAVAAPLMLVAMWINYTRGGFVAIVLIVVHLSKGITLSLWPAADAYLWEMTETVVTPRMVRITLVVCALICLASFARTWRRKLISQRTLALLVIAWAAGTLLGATMLRWLVSSVYDISFATCSAWLASLMLLALTPLAISLRQVYRVRHR